jgi:hypothetical protein
VTVTIEKRKRPGGLVLLQDQQGQRRANGRADDGTNSRHDHDAVNDGAGVVVLE